MRAIAHIVNPVNVGEESDLFIAQPTTFETMQTAQEFAADRVRVELYSAQYLEDHLVVPKSFQMTPDLDRSILDFGVFRIQRKLPLVRDILDRLYEATDAEFLIYTNVDIALMPHFYLAVDRLISLGYDAFTISRRTISKVYTQTRDIALMAAQVGEPHPGHDCFVFRRDAYPKYQLEATCIGPPKFDWVLVINLAYHSSEFRRFEDLHLTFHIGDDRAGKSLGQIDYHLFTEHQLRKVAAHYRPVRSKISDSFVREMLGRYSPYPIEAKMYQIKEKLYPIKKQMGSYYRCLANAIRRLADRLES